MLCGARRTRLSLFFYRLRCSWGRYSTLIKALFPILSTTAESGCLQLGLPNLFMACVAFEGFRLLRGKHHDSYRSDYPSTTGTRLSTERLQINANSRPLRAPKPTSSLLESVSTPAPGPPNPDDLRPSTKTSAPCLSSRARRPTEQPYNRRASRQPGSWLEERSLGPNRGLLACCTEDRDSRCAAAGCPQLARNRCTHVRGLWDVAVVG